MSSPLPAERFPRALGDYLLLARIGVGGMGVVYQAAHTPTGRQCALKLIRRDALEEPDDAARGAGREHRFATEIEAASQLDHPDILRVRHGGRQEGEWFLEMELVTGGTLAERLKSGPLPPREAAALIARIARAVQFAHDRGVLHRDLKPGNILLDESGGPRLADFGLARLLNRESNLTRTLAWLGTPTYMAPELASGAAREATTAADTYSLGAMLYECLTGHAPFAADHLPSLLRRIADETPAPMTGRAADGQPIPADLALLTRRAMAKEPYLRFNSAGEFAEELERFLRDEPIRSRDVPAVERLWLWCRRHPPAAFGITASLVGGLAALLVILGLWRQSERASTEARSQSATLESIVIRDTFKLCNDALAVGERDRAMRRMIEALAQLPEAPGFDLWLRYRLAHEFFLHEGRALPQPDAVRAVAFDRPRPRVLAVGDGGSWLYERPTGKPLLHVPVASAVPGGPDDHTRDAWISADGEHLLAHEGTGRLALWDLRAASAPALLWTNDASLPFAVAPARKVFAMVVPSGRVVLAALQPDGLAGEPFLSPPPGARTAFLTLPAPPSPITHLCLNTNGTFLVAALADGSLARLATTNAAWLRVGTYRHNKTTFLGMAPDGSAVLVVASQSFTGIRCRDDTGLFEFSSPSAITAAAVAPSGRWFALLDEEGRLETRSLRDGRLQADPMLLPQRPTRLRITTTGRYLMVCSAGGEVRLFRVEPPRLLAGMRRPEAVLDADFQDTYRLLLTASPGGGARYWEMSRAIQPGLLATNLPTPLRDAWLLPPETVVAPMDTNLARAHPRLLALTEANHLLVITPLTNSLDVQRIDRLGRTSVATLAAAPTPAVWYADAAGLVWQRQLASAEPAKAFLQLPAPVAQLAVSGDGRTLLAATAEQLFLVSLRAEHPRVLAGIPAPGIHRLAFSPQSDLAGAAFAHGLLLFDLSAAERPRPRLLTAPGVVDLAFSPDGRALAAACADGTLRVWSADDGHERIHPSREVNDPISVAWNRAGTRLLVGGLGAAALLDAGTGEEVLSFGRLPGWNRASSSPDDRLALFANASGLRLWSVPEQGQLKAWEFAFGGPAHTPPHLLWTGADGGCLVWSETGYVAHLRPPPPLDPGLRQALLEWVLDLVLAPDGRLTDLTPVARADRLAQLRAAASAGTLHRAYARHLPR